MKRYVKIVLLLTCLVGFNLQADATDIKDKSKSSIQTEDIVNKESKVNMENWLNSTFGLQPYKANYLLPFGISSRTYEGHEPGVIYSNKEAELQVSLKLKVGKNLFGLNEKYYVSYTHRAYWQIYVQSSPFRESLYNPEGFVIFPITDNKSIFHMRSFKVAIAHMSNGQPNTTNALFTNGFNLSKSINYFYYTLRLQHKMLLTDITLLTPFPGSDNLSDNPDLMKYLGYNKIKFTYFYKKHMMSLMLRGNIGSLRGAVEMTYSHPLKQHTYFYAKFFSGYVESLIDYNKNITKFSIGFSFSR